MSDLRSKALGYLRSGAVEVSVVAEARADDGVTRIVQSFVQGHARRHVVDGRILISPAGERLREAWSCTCPRYAEPTCPHRAAVQLVTGGTTEARP